MSNISNKMMVNKVIKRDGKKVDFDGTKIALAIKKGFDSVTTDGINTKYSQVDVNKVYEAVLINISNLQTEKIKIEEIQDMIEDELKKQGYEDVYESFSSYREKRAQSRKLFFDEKRQHKFLKALENLGLKTSKEEGSVQIKRHNTAMSMLLQYGGTISGEFAKAYLMKKKFEEAHENGDIYIHNLNFFPMGTTTCCQIDLNKLFKDGFSTGNGFIREPNDISSYTALTARAIQVSQNDQHGVQSIPALDFYMAPGILKTFKKQFKQIVYDYLELTDFDKFIAINGIEREIERISTIDFDIEIFYKYCRESEELKRMFNISYKKALEKTNKITYQSMEAFIHNLNTVNSRAGGHVPLSSVCFGTDTTPEGRMVSKNFLEALAAGIGNHETAQFPISIFKIKEGINYKPEDTNYDIFERACEVSLERSILSFEFLDSSFNKKFYSKGNYDTEVAYMGYRTRVMENIVDESKQITPGRGILSATSINLPRLGIKNGISINGKANIDNFFKELEEKLDLVKDQLLERFEMQCSKKVYNFPFLLGQGLWIDSEKLKDTDNLRKVLKHGTMSIGFTGLAECLKALTGKHHGESEEAQELGLKIISFMREKCDRYSEKYNLNFCLAATPSTNLTSELIKMDQAIYGKIKNITDKEIYTDSFQLPKDYKISMEEKIKIEAPYHKLTNGGHIIEIAIEENAKKDDFMKIIELMKNYDIGCGIIYRAKVDN